MRCSDRPHRFCVLEKLLFEINEAEVIRESDVRPCNDDSDGVHQTCLCELADGVFVLGLRELN